MLQGASPAQRAEGADAANALGGSSAEAKQQRLVELRAAAKKAEATGSNAEKLKAAAAVCAAEAELEEAARARDAERDAGEAACEKP